MSNNNGIGRDERGRFAQGSPGGPGRPKRATEEDYLASMSEAVSLRDWKAIAARAKEDALAGDHKARQWLTDYLVGKPTQRSELVVDHSELRAEAQASLIHDLMLQAEQNGGNFHPTIIDDAFIEKMVNEELAAENDAEFQKQGSLGSLV